MRTIHWLYLVTVALFVASVGLFIAGASANESTRVAAEVSEVATIRQIMDGIVMPAAGVVFGSVATIVDANGTDERQPRTAEEWAFVGANAAALIESGNLLMLGRRLESVDDRDDWIAMTRAMMDAAAVALKAADARDVEGLFSSGEAINEACDTCHTKYQVP